MPARAVRLLLPEGTSAAAALAVLRGRLDVAPDGTRTLQRTFWDTFDGRLHEAGLALAGGGRLALAEDRAYAEQAGAEHQADGARRMLAADLPAGALRDRVEELVEMRAVTPVARLRSRLHALKVLDTEDKTVVRLTVEARDPCCGRRSGPAGGVAHTPGGPADRDPGGFRGRAHGGRAHGRGRLRPPSRAAGAYEALWAEVRERIGAGVAAG